MKINRLKELEKIADKLGIGQNREVKCVGCKKKVKFKKAIVLSNKKKVTYLCKDCYKKLESGKLNKKQIDENDILKQIEKIRKLPDPNIPAPYPQPPYEPKPIPWEPAKPIKWDPPYTSPYTGIDVSTAKDKTTYTICSMKDKFLKLEGFNANNSNGSPTK